ncbi:MAG: hypothetical protein JWO44_85 [Bacteroidetes bacterium]|nr:hypothetical protein [Bacteroidota bacterium]
MRTLLFSVLIFSSFSSFGGNFRPLENLHPGSVPKSLLYQANKREYESWYFDVGYSSFNMLGNYFHGGTSGLGLQGTGRRLMIGGHCGVDFALHKIDHPLDSLPAPEAFRNCVFLNFEMMFGVVLQERLRMEIPLKTNLPLVWKQDSFAIPAFVNGNDFYIFAPGLNFVFRLNSKRQEQNAYIGLGTNYRLAYNVSRNIGKNANYSSMSYFLFLRFDILS